jgi:hypothetical protein
MALKPDIIFRVIKQSIHKSATNIYSLSHVKNMENCLKGSCAPVRFYTVLQISFFLPLMETCIFQKGVA